MAVVKLAKFRIFFSRADSSRFLKALQEFGESEIIPRNGNENPSLSAERHFINEIDKALEILREASKTLPSSARVEHHVRPIFPEDVQTIDHDRTWESEIRRITSLADQKKDLLEKEQTLLEELKILHEWSDLTFIPSTATYEAVPVCGTAEASSFEKMKNELHHLTDLISFQELRRKSDEVTFCVLTHASVEYLLDLAMKQNGARRVSLPPFERLPSETIPIVQKVLHETQQQLANINAELSLIALELPRLERIADMVHWEFERKAQQSHLAEAEFSGSIDVWMAEDRIGALERKCADLGLKAVAVIQIPLNKGEVPPVALHNKRSSALEPVTEMYGMPAGHEPDPTPWLAPFFVTFFGLCLTDAGYGIILILLVLSAKFFGKLNESMNRWANLILYGGVSTVILGALFGGWFGVTPSQMPSQFEAILGRVWIFDPLKDPISVLYLSLALGFIQMATGIFVAAWWKWRRGDRLDALLDHGPWLFLFFSVGVWIASLTERINASWSIWFIYASLILLVITQGRSSSSLFGKLSRGIGSLYGLIGYFSDILSYSRLLALGLATGIIASVVNLLASLTYGEGGILSTVLAIIVLIIGHTFNISINVLGAYIHSARLQYVEFFPKFMEGGGRAFRPFRREPRPALGAR